MEVDIMKQAGVIWVDANGFSRLLTINSDTGAAPITTAMVAPSNGNLQRFWEGTPISAAAVGINAPYNSVLDSAVLSFETGAGSIVTLRLPAPTLAVFKADQITVDPAGAAATLIATCLGLLTDPGGSPVVNYLGGFYSRTGRALVGGS